MKIFYYLAAAALLGMFVSSCTSQQRNADIDTKSKPESVAEKPTIRFATFNASLSRKTAGKLLADLEKGKAIQLRRVAEIIQRIRPDVVLLNEVDYHSSDESDGPDKSGKVVALLQKSFLNVSQNEQKPITYPYVYIGPVNTGVLSGLDINQDGKVELPNDGFGFGSFPGQYGMVVLSRYPIDEPNVRTFQKFLWKDMPDAKRATDPKTSKPFHPDEVFNAMRLSSKSHWDVPIKVDDETVHLICSHPTPPVFDGPADRNGCRNHDEIRMIADYVSGVPGKSDYLTDDNGVAGGLESGEHFVIVGDLNADPNDGDSMASAAKQLTDNPLINNTVTPTSKGAKIAAETSGGKNVQHTGDHAQDTGDFRDDQSGNVRIDYCLPSTTLTISDCGVFWPAEDDETFDLNRASDHHLVWVDVVIE